jgi:multiple sugar transport system permease protein
MGATRSLNSAARWWPRSRRRQDQWLGVLLVLPVVLFVVVFVLGPLFSTLVLSFYSRRLTAPNQPSIFVGLRNYRYIFGQGIVQPALFNSIFISAATVLIQFVIGMAIALLLNRQFAGRGAVRATFIMAWGVPTIAAAFVFRWLFDATYGAINKVLLDLHVISAGVPWLGEAHTALFTVIMANTWKGLPYPVLIFLAGLQLIPQEIRDAARIDGAGWWQEFLTVTMPHLRFVTIIFIVLRFIWSFNAFDLVYLLTGGGPAGATMVLPVQIYIEAFRTFDVGVASALGTVMAVTLIAFTVVFLRVATVREDADA